MQEQVSKSEKGKSESKLSSFAAIGKDLVAMLRDSIVLVIAVLLLFWPTTINTILVKAGFEEGSFAGLKWKAKLDKTDDALLVAQSVISDLREQNQRLSSALEEATSRNSDANISNNVKSLGEINRQLVRDSTRVQSAVTDVTSGNAQMIQKYQLSAGRSVVWGVVLGGDRNLRAARHEIERALPTLGITNAAIYFRQGSFRSVATNADRVQADQILRKAKERREDAYIVNMDTWCPDVKQMDGYFECNT